MIEKIINKAIELNFGYTALGILITCENNPTNPYRYFGKRYRRSWSYNYFSRLVDAGLLIKVKTPQGCKSHHWYVTSEIF